MGIHTQPSLLHWNYFIALEEDVERLSRYIEFTESNFNTYSIEIAHLYLAASSEVDVVAKQLCLKINNQTKADSIKKYREIINESIPELKNLTVTLPRFGLELSPWSNWNDEKTPIWWDDHNKVKHQRHQYFERANLKNSLNAMSALFLLILYYYRDPERKKIEPPPSIFTPPKSLAKIGPAIEGRMGLFYVNK